MRENTFSLVLYWLLLLLVFEGTQTDSLITGCFQNGGWATGKLIIECLLLKSFVTDCALWPRLWASVWIFVVVCECGGGGG